jgi:hypothetical protein
MMRSSIRIAMVIAITFGLAVVSIAQPSNEEKIPQSKTEKREARPYKVLTSGKQITIKSSKEIRSIMVWTASGHRILEEKDISVTSYTFRVSSNISEKIFFLMIKFPDGKLFTEKIGL